MEDFPLECFTLYDGLIRLTQEGINSFTVTYGVQIEPGLSYSRAAERLGAVIMHDAACEYCLNNNDID